MTHLDIEIKRLRDEAVEMFMLVISQMKKSRDSLINYNKSLAREVNNNEIRVNAIELRIDKYCENLFALMNPVANDLRFVLAVLKINYNLERIGDIADGITWYVTKASTPYDEELLSATRVPEMFEISIEMLTNVLEAFLMENAEIAGNIFKKDDELDAINDAADKIIEDYIRRNPDNIQPALHIISAVRKLERTGDQIKNIAEEIIFYLEARVLKHTSKDAI